MQHPLERIQVGRAKDNHLNAMFDRHRSELRNENQKRQRRVCPESYSAENCPLIHNKQEQHQ